MLKVSKVCLCKKVKKLTEFVINISGNNHVEGIETMHAKIKYISDHNIWLKTLLFADISNEIRIMNVIT